MIRVGALAAKEALHIRRDPRTLYLALGMPVVMLLLFGFGVSFDLDHIPIAVVDADRTPASRALVRDFVSSNELVVGAPAADQDEAEALMRDGQILAVLAIPRGLEQDLARGETVRLGLTVDGSDGVSANQVLAKADAIGRAATARIAAEAGLRQSPPMSVKVWTRFNPAGRSALFLVPGLAAYLLAIAAVLLTALAIAGEWERGSMEQLFASPVGRLEIVLGKLLPYVVIGMLQLLLVLAAGSWVFDVPVRGSLPALLFAGLLFLVGMLGQGLFISVVTKNQLVATQAGAISSLLPSMILSGFLFPIENMPRVLQWLSLIIPARYLVHALRGVMLKGAQGGDLWRDFAALAAFALVILTLATARFKRRLA
jgi:ABC-2 type transport system permease protein